MALRRRRRRRRIRIRKGPRIKRKLVSKKGHSCAPVSVYAYVCVRECVCVCTCVFGLLFCMSVSVQPTLSRCAISKLYVPSLACDKT